MNSIKDDEETLLEKTWGNLVHNITLNICIIILILSVINSDEFY